MNAALSSLILLLALDGPIGDPRPATLARFADGSPITIPATFLVASGREVAVGLSVYLDGETLAVPLVHVPFTAEAPDLAMPGLRAGKFDLPLPPLEKPVRLRGVIEAVEPGGVARVIYQVGLKLFPRDPFVREWKTVARSGVADLAVGGELPGLRELLREHNILFREVDPGSGKGFAEAEICVLRSDENAPATGAGFPSRGLVYARDPSAVLAWGIPGQTAGYPPIVVASEPRDFRADPIAQQLLLEYFRALQPEPDKP